MLIQLRIDLPDDVLEQISSRAAQLALELLTSEPTAPTAFMTVAETAELLRCSRQRVYDLVSSGRLTRYKDGSRVLINRGELLHYLVQHDAPVMPHTGGTRIPAGEAR